MNQMGWDLDKAIAKLHRLWWWCGDYAWDGDISRHTPETIASAVGLPQDQGKEFLEALSVAGFVDKTPYLRMHDWWTHFGEYLRGKFARTPEKWKGVENRYTNVSQTLGKCLLLDKGDKGEEIKKEDNNTMLTFASFWKAYPRKVGKDKALKAWCDKKPNLEVCLKALEWQSRQDQWIKDHGQYIPHPTTWINQGRWSDEPIKAHIGTASPIPGKYGHLGGKV